jgi:hypothetical protein
MLKGVLVTVPFEPLLSGQDRNFVGCLGPSGGVAEVEAAGGVEGVFGESGEVTGG